MTGVQTCALPISDIDLQIPSVTKFCINVCYQHIDYKIFRRFLHLFPNLISLELDLQQPLLHDILKHEHEDQLIKIVLARIEQLEIISWNEFYFDLNEY